MKLNMVEAINLALKQEMKKDKDVIILGEDVGIDGGVFRVTEGLLKLYGEKRVIDTPLAPIDKDYRDNLIDFMSTSLEDTQIILLVKDTEYTENVKNKLKPKTGIIKLLKHDKHTSFSEVVDYGWGRGL